jgi:hypothetical protein
MAEWHAMFACLVKDRGNKPGRIGHLFKDKFGAWPPRIPPKLIKPNAEVLALVRSRDIAYAKAQRRRAA